MTRARRPRGVRRLLTGLAGVALLGGLALASSVQQTDAAWTDVEMGTATFTAGQMPTPQSVSCTANSLLGAVQSITIVWQVPANSTDGLAYDFEYGMRDGGAVEGLLDALLESVDTTESSGQFTTVLSTTDLSELLGGTASFAVRMTGPGGWVSPWLVADVTFPLLIGSRACDAVSIVSQ